MKWLPPTGAIQHTSCGRYCVQTANSQHWVAYELSQFGTTGRKLGERNSEEAAQQLCDDHERVLITARQIA